MKKHFSTLMAAIVGLTLLVAPFALTGCKTLPNGESQLDPVKASLIIKGLTRDAVFVAMTENPEAIPRLQAAAGYVKTLKDGLEPQQIREFVADLNLDVWAQVAANQLITIYEIQWAEHVVVGIDGIKNENAKLFLEAVVDGFLEGVILGTPDPE